MRPRRRWLSFSLRTLLVLITALSLLLGLTVKSWRDRKAAISALKDHGASYAIKVESPEWLRTMVGDDECFYNAVRVSFKPGYDGNDPSGLFGDDELKAMVAHLNRFSKLSSLEFSGSEVTDEGLPHLQKLNHLESLHFNAMQITDDGLQHLGAIRSLKEIELTRCPVTPEGVAKLQEALPKCKISIRD